MVVTPTASVRRMDRTDSSLTLAHPRFAEALRALGLDVEVRRFPDAVRTAAQAADAIGCAPSEIVKSLIFTAWGSHCASEDERGEDERGEGVRGKGCAGKGCAGKGCAFSS
ncbi:hypothetical protein GCM10023237_40400 [Streptomyces coeruleoprunus]